MAGSSALGKRTPAQRPDDSRYNTSRGTSTVLWGDSYCAINLKSSGTPNTYGGTLYYDARGWMPWANFFLGQRINVVNNAGITGQKTADWVPRFDTDVRPYNPAIVMMASPITNDVIGSIALATVQANITTALDKVASIGALAVIFTAPPKSNTALTGGQLGILHGYNQWIKAVAAGAATDSNGKYRRNIVVIDVHDALADGTSADNWINKDTVQYTADGTHPAAWGAARIGKLLYQALDPILPRVAVLPGPAASVNNAGRANIITNPGFTGTGGTLSNGATGVCPDSWTVASNNGSAFPGTVVASKVASTDQIGAGWFQIVSTVSANGVYVYPPGLQPASGLFAVGSTVEAWCEFQADGDWSTVTNLNLYLQQFTTGGTHADVWGFDMSSETTTGLPLTENPLTSGVFRSPPLIVPAAATTLQWKLYWKGLGTFRIRRPALVRVS